MAVSTNKYVQGSTARKMELAPDVRQIPSKKRVSNTTRKNREKARHMSLPYVLVLTAALVFATISLTGYIEVRSAVTNHVKTISRMEARYNELKLTNEETYNRINSSIDLEDIKAVAIGELGMVYAQEGQIILIQDEETDYVRQYSDVE